MERKEESEEAEWRGIRRLRKSDNNVMKFVLGTLR